MLLACLLGGREMLATLTKAILDGTDMAGNSVRLLVRKGAHVLLASNRPANTP